MSIFLGGSAYNMVRDVAGGFVLVSERTFRSFTSRDFVEFGMEAERLLREVRSEQPELSDTEAIQKRQRRMQRLRQAITLATASAARRA
jgi:hypothetical protein